VGSSHDVVRVTEGELKADVCTALTGVLTIALPGVPAWRAALPVLRHLQPRQVWLAFDADWRTNPVVARALASAATAITTHGWTVAVEVWQPSEGKGIDDVLAAGHRPRRQGAAFAFGVAVRAAARPAPGPWRTVSAEEVGRWRP
jgi:hypothetical protein